MFLFLLLHNAIADNATVATTLASAPSTLQQRLLLLTNYCHICTYC